MMMVIKRYKIWCVTLVVLCVSSLTFRAWSQNNEETIIGQKSDIVNIPDSIGTLLKTNVATIDSLANVNNALKGLLRDSQRETESKIRDITLLQNKIDELQNITIKRLEAANDTLQRRLISMASNFLYIPYEEYSIEEIAIPAFNSTKGTPAYTRYQNRLPLLENYKGDIEKTIETLSQMEKVLSVPFLPMIKEKAKEYRNNLISFPVYQRYVAYDDWENTFLGNQISIILNLLKSPTEGTASELKNIRLKLEKLLNNN